MPIKIAAETTGKAAAWDIVSLIDLEVAVSRDEGVGDAELKQRERQFYLSLGRAGVPSNLLKNRSWLLWQWLHFRRPDLIKDGSTPGGEVAEWLNTIKHVGFWLIALLGASWVWGNLSSKTVIAPVFAVLTTGIPFLLSGVGFYLLMVQRVPSLHVAPSIFRGIIVRALTAGVKSGIRHLSADHARNILAAVGALRIRFSERGGIVVSQLAHVTHLLGLGMVIGISVALFCFKTFSDQNYGWMTHASWVNEKTISGFVRTVATPWRPFAGEGIGYPTKEQIARSHFFRDNQPKEDIHVHTDNVTWSSFLLLTSLTWGVLPRLGLFFAGIKERRRACTAETFTQHRFHKVWTRMTLKTDESVHPEPQESATEVMLQTVISEKQPDETVVQQNILLVPKELSSETMLERFCSVLKQEHGFAVTQTRVFPSLPSERNTLLIELETPTSVGHFEILLLEEAFTPPTQALRKFLSMCRERFPKASIRIVLIGDSSVAGHWERPSELYCSVWKESIADMGDARISMLLIQSSLIPQQ